MFGLPNPYIILIAAGAWAISLVGVGLTVRHYVSQGYELRLSQEAAAGQKLLTQETARRLAAEQKQEAANNQIEEAHAKAQSDIDAATVDFNARLARSVRPYSKCAGTPTAGTKAVDSGSDKDLESAGLFVPTATLEAVGTLAKSADETVAAMQACRAWAITIGR